MKRYLSLILAFALLLSVAVPANGAEGTINVTLSADKETVAPGETVTLTLSIDKAVSNMFCFEYWIYFNSDLLEITGTTIGEATSNTDIGGTATNDNGTYFNVFALSKEGTAWELAAGTIASITFTAKADVSGDAGFVLYQEVGLTDYDTYEETPAALVNNAANVSVGTPAAAVAITLNETAVELSSMAGEAFLTATVTGTDSEVQWASSDLSVAEVYSNSRTEGQVIAMAAGECDITATVDGVSATCHVVVSDPVLEEIPFTFKVDGNTVEAIADGTVVCDYGPRLHKLILTVPADAKFLEVNYDYMNLYVIADHDVTLLEDGPECTVDLTRGYKVLDLWDAEDMDKLFHLYIEFAENEIPATAGYTFAASADVSAENGENAVVKVNVTGHSDESVTGYHAYDVTLTFDSDKLEYVGYDGAVKSDNGQVKVEGNTIRIVGCGAEKGFGTEIAALTFKTKAEGEANVTISKVQVSDKQTAVDENIPEAEARHSEDDTNADETPEQSVIVVPYSVTKPDFVSGNDKVLHGESYTFSYADTTNYTYSGLTVTVGGVAVENLTADENGIYTVENVTGAVVITAAQTANSYDVTKPGNVTGPDKATYGENYEFTVTPSEGKEIESVTVTIGDETIEISINEDGEYVIDGKDISGPITITVTEKDKAATETTITFSGVEAAEVEGGLTQTAAIGQAFTFKLNKAEGFEYTVTVGETELTETDGQYTIPAELVVAGGVTVTITKVDATKAAVDVREYISLDGKVMFLVTAKWNDKILAYGEGNTMFWSSKYTVTGYDETGAYCWLVLSADEMKTVDQVKAAAEAAIVEAAEGVAATSIGYDYDINETTKVDVNDAQLAYDMYNASYMEFTGNLPMLKFLEADMTYDGKLDVNDVAAIINYIVNGAAN